PVAPPARVLPFRGLTAWLGGSLAAAAVMASLLLVVGRPAPLPPYDLTPTGGDLSRRGTPTGTPTVRVLHRGSLLAVDLRPRTTVSGRVEGRWFVARGAELRELPAARQEVSASGSVRLSGTLGDDLDIAPGEWSLWGVVGRPGKLPNASVVCSLNGSPPFRQRDWIALRCAQTLRVEADRRHGGTRRPGT
ncbi:MAG: hypothetical protein M3O15_16110, partial [Acidobacteriota bacterium]|nr:hypothetical protein [Acidobacteriota bacterium]